MIVKHAGLFYMGGYFETQQLDLYHQAILLLLPEIKPEAISLVDAIAPPDFVLNSSLGMSDGNVRKNLYTYYREYIKFIRYLKHIRMGKQPCCYIKMPGDSTKANAFICRNSRQGKGIIDYKSYITQWIMK